MKIIRLNGTDKKLFELIGPLVMNPSILRLNNNYPFKTASNFIWHILIESSSVVGFIPLKPTQNGYNIDNYYFKLDDENIITILLEDVIESVGCYELTALVHKRNVDMFKKLGFSTFIEWKKYDKMIYINKKNDD